MPSKYYQRNFTSGYYYHIYNRGSRKQNIFLDKADYKSFKDIISYYFRFPNGIPPSRFTNFNQEITEEMLQVRNLLKVNSSFRITAFCLLPNHFHLLVKQVGKSLKENSITNFMRRLSITYSMYYKDKYDHSGTLFEGKYKNVIVTNDRQLLYLTKYIHRNPLELLNSNVKLSNYIHSSYPSYISRLKYDWINFGDILKFYSKTSPRLTYKAFVEEKADIPDSISNLLLE